MRSPVFVLTFAAAALIATGGFALNRYAAARNARGARESAQRDLEKAVKIAAEHPRSFGPEAVPAQTGAALKSLAQGLATSRGVTIGYLTENDREADKGRRERQVMIRLVSPGHQNLVLFLQDLESRGGGAKVKELHLRPSKDVTDAYEEAEVILSKTAPVAEEKKP